MNYVEEIYATFVHRFVNELAFTLGLRASLVIEQRRLKH